jgi:hypothetical protein
MGSVLKPVHGVVREAFDDEVVIINLDSGTYYSLNGSGVTVWTTIEDGATLERIVMVMAAHYHAETAKIEADVRQLIDRLLTEQLICEVPAGTNEAGSVSSKGERRQYEPPELSVFTDMQELLRLDPVHDVDNTGWPHRPKSDAEE